MDVDDIATLRRPAWQAQAACRGQNPADYFVERGFNVSDEVKQRCARCPVAAECKAYAIDTPIRLGWWNGSERERQRIRRNRQRNDAIAS
jgi:WhiB family redox-sensing transcriptional regulator